MHSTTTTDHAFRTEVDRPADAASTSLDDNAPALLSRGGRPVSVVHLVAELAPFARTGGLGEAVASLARFQALGGIATSVIMPLYRQARENAGPLQLVGEEFTVEIGGRTETARLLRQAGTAGWPNFYFIDNPAYFDRPGLYGIAGADYDDNARRYAFFARAALAALPRIAEPPTLLHAHDWQTALAMVYLRTHHAADPWYAGVSTVLTVHNAGYQGKFPASMMPDLGLSWDLFNMHQLEWHGWMNCLKGGLVFADAVTTVSPTHAYELRTPAGGFGLNGAFTALRDRFVGITNGIDQQVWDPETDPLIAYRFSRDDLRGKRRCRWALQHTFGLQRRAGVPIFALTARLVSQKGLDLILGDPGYFALDAQFIFLGNGEPRYEAALTEIASRAPSRIAVELDFNEHREHWLLAGADMCLMPSQYEPCGLTQMRAQRYGTIPVARRVGGLADTIEDGVTGFLFSDYTASDFMAAAVRSLGQYRERAGWREMMRVAMSRDFGWARSENRYRQLYHRVLGVTAS